MGESPRTGTSYYPRDQANLEHTTPGRPVAVVAALRERRLTAAPADVEALVDIAASVLVGRAAVGLLVDDGPGRGWRGESVVLGVEALRKRVRGGNVAIGCGAWADRRVAVVDG